MLLLLTPLKHFRGRNIVGDNVQSESVSAAGTKEFGWEFHFHLILVHSHLDEET